MNRHPDTLCVQEGWQPKNGEPRVLPIIQSTTFKYDSSEHVGDQSPVHRHRRGRARPADLRCGAAHLGHVERGHLSTHGDRVPARGPFRSGRGAHDARLGADEHAPDV